MPRDCWYQLGDKARTRWDQFSDKEKASILGIAHENGSQGGKSIAKPISMTPVHMISSKPTSMSKQRMLLMQRSSMMLKR